MVGQCGANWANAAFVSRRRLRRHFAIFDA
jgi:hypothetical protein